MKIAALLAVAGVAGAAQAQSGTWMADVTPLDADTVQVSLSLQMDSGGAPFVALAATIFDVLNSAGSDLGGIDSWEVKNSLADLTGDLTTTDGESLFGVNAGQLTLFGPFTSANPIEVLCFNWSCNPGLVLGDGSDVSYETSTDNLILWVGQNKDDSDDVKGVASDVAFGWQVVPTPASAALLGLGGLALARRRR